MACSSLGLPPLERPRTAPTTGPPRPGDAPLVSAIAAPKPPARELLSGEGGGQIDGGSSAHRWCRGDGPARPARVVIRRGDGPMTALKARSAGTGMAHP